jgi:septal ring factor EnvC (AmiA/AmiB activator)
MQVPPSTSLLHALSRVSDPSAPAAPSRAEAARAAAKAAFQNVKNPAASTQVVPAAPQQNSVAPATQASASQPGRILPRGSVVNIVV